MFNYLSKNNPFHVYKIEGNKIIRDDFLMSFEHPDFIKCEYIELPDLTYEENNAIIASIKKDTRFKDMVIALYYNQNKYQNRSRINNIKTGDYTPKVKKVLKIISDGMNRLLLQNETI